MAAFAVTKSSCTLGHVGFRGASCNYTPAQQPSNSTVKQMPSVASTGQRPTLEDPLQTASVCHASVGANGAAQFLREFGVQALDTKEPLTSLQLEQLSTQFPGSKLERRGKHVTVATCDSISGATGAEAIRQLGNWAISNDTHIAGGSDTGFRVDTFKRVKARVSKGLDVNTHCKRLREADSILSPDAWVLSTAYHDTVKKRGFPELKGCKDALLVEVLSRAADLNPKTGSVAKSAFDKADDWMRNGAACLLIINPYSEELYNYDARTWREGRWEKAWRIDSVAALTPRPDLFLGLVLNMPELMKSIRKAKGDSL